jgi:spore germination protein YaaH
MSRARTIRSIALAAALAASAARADAPPGRDAPPQRARSIHELEALAHRGAPVPRDRVSSPPIAPRLRSPSLTREVHGYHPWWMGSSWESYDWSLLSTVAFFSLELDGTGAIVDDHGWPWTPLIEAAHEEGVRVIVTATLFSTAAIDMLLSSPARRQVAVTNLVAEAQGADGVSIDFEGVPGARKQDLVTFLGELQSALAAALPDPYLSIATPAVDWDNAFDYDELAARCDHLMVMAYDYHWSGSAFTGPVAPLGGWGTYDVPWTVQDYFTWGTLPGQLLLGVPYYGYLWDTASGSPGAATTSSGVARTYAQAEVEAELHGALWDAPSSTPWIRWQAPGWKQLWYDDAASLSAKYDLVLGEGLAGVGIWALGYDGANGELWIALAESFSSAIGVPGGPLASAPALRLAGANPFRDRADLEFVLPRPGPARITVHDVAGKRVRALWSGWSDGIGRASWNGAAADGRPVAAGTYVVRLESDEGTRSLRVVRLR